MSKGITTVKPSKLHKGIPRRLQGMHSDVGEIKLKGEKFTAKVTDAIVGDPRIRRSIDESSEISLPIHDPRGELRRSKLLETKFDIELDDLWFRFVRLNRQGDTLTLYFEDREVARTRIAPGPLKAYRDQITRAEFVLMNLRQVPGPTIPFYCPELHTKQPIEKASDGRDAEREAPILRGKGIDSGAKLTVKGVAATPEQLRLGDRALRVAEADNAPSLAMVALIMALIQESVMSNPAGGDDSSVGPLQLLDIHGSVESRRDVENVVHLFLTKGFTGAGGAIQFAKTVNSPAEICARVQGNLAGAGDYAPWEGEARKWVEAFGGGTIEGSVTKTITERYAYQRKPNEKIWDCVKRLADEVEWRRFATAGLVYYIAETDLMRSQVRMRVNDDTPGLEAIDFDWDAGKKRDEITVKARVRDWAAPPGTVLEAEGQGAAADGRYLVTEIDRSLFSDLATITAHRAQKPLPEPAPETRTKSIDLGGKSGGTVSGGDVGARLLRWAQSQIGVTEGSAKQVEYASKLGFSPALPWCSIFVGYGLKFACGVKDLPGNPAYSGDWIGWSGGEKVSPDNLKPGDLVIFDWGDGGMTDHIAIYAGSGQVVGGNQSNAVTKTSFNRGACVAAVRVHG